MNTFGIPLEESIRTPIGLLRGESGNRFEETMLGFVLSHAGNLNIPMNVSDVYLLNSIDSCTTDRKERKHILRPYLYYCE